MARVAPGCLGPLPIILPAGLLLSGCLTAVAPETVYRMTSDPEGAEIYAGIGPDDLGYYVTTPYERRTTQTLNWAGRYFQARKAGYQDSGIHHQPSSLMGATVHVHFDLDPNATLDDFEPYRQRNTVEAYYEFLDQYPDAPFEDEVLQHLVERIAELPDAAEQYRALLDAYPEAAPFVLERQLADLASRDVADVHVDPADDTTDVGVDDAGIREDSTAHTTAASVSETAADELSSGADADGTEADSSTDQDNAPASGTATASSAPGAFEADLMDGFWITQIPIRSGRTGEYAGYDHIWEMRFVQRSAATGHDRVWHTQPGAEGRVWYTRKYFQLGAVRGEPATGVYDWWSEGDLIRVGHVATGAARFTLDRSDMTRAFASENYFPLERSRQVDCNLGRGVWREGSYQVERCRDMNSL